MDLQTLVSRSVVRCTLATVFAFAFLSNAAPAQVVDLRTAWQTKHGLPEYCKDAKQARFVVQGPGKLTIDLQLEPYRSAGRNAYLPIRWMEYRPNGTNTGWGDATFAGFQSIKAYVGGKPSGSYIEGAPLRVVTTYMLDAKRYDMGVNLGAPCQSFGGGGFDQFAQVQHLVIDFAASSPAAPQTPATAPATGTPRSIFNNGNGGSVTNGPMRETVITLATATRITKITDYHWNNGAGAPAGTIGLRSTTGRVYGPWRATLQGKGYWVVVPDVVLPAGRYIVVDSDPSTWSQNAASGGAGMSWAEGI